MWPVVGIAVTIGNSIPSLRIFTIWRVSGWQRSMRRPPRTRMKNGPPFIIDRSSPGGISRVGVFHKFSNMYTPLPKTAPDQGILNIYFPSRETPKRWDVHPCLRDTLLGVGCCCVVSWTRKLQHRESNNPPKTTLYITWGTSSTCAAPPKRRLGPCMCLDNAYVEFLSLYIWSTTKLLYKHRSMLWSFGSFDIVKIIFFHSFCMLYHVWLCSCHPCDLTLLFLLSY